ncbi:PHD finger protein 21B-like [Megalops cyprinoides]|uniref:PHD finger protein 21B-like n=1 Tax=Megalops cyprinoides TaxID=118141 RepID=UPI001863BB54|nr:PHD finger protein 21B-like [Megalops cyprinoides]
MELQGLQEALKVEISCHQDGEVMKQLHERQSSVTTLSEKQKLAVRGCPVGSTKPLSLVKPSQSIAISVTPAKAAVSMVTAHMNGQKAPGPEPLQTAPGNLQTAGKVAGSGLSLSRRAGEPPHSQMLGNLSAVPIRVPQVSSLTRLAVQAPTVPPQVRPKTLIPDSLPHSPSQEQQASRPPSLQRATAVVSPRTQSLAPPSSNSTASLPTQLPNGRADPLPLPPTSAPASVSGAGVAYAIISASPAGPVSVSAVSEAVKVQPLLLSADSKVIIIQPQVPSSSQNSPEPQPSSPAQETTPAPSPPTKKKKDEDSEKIAFMVALGLVTTEHLEEIQSKRQERKRRSTANPAYSGLFEPERKRNYLNSPLFMSARDTEDLCWKVGSEHDEHCVVCKEGGDLQPCYNCTRAYHLDCLQPPLSAPPKGTWLCPKCQKKVLNKDNMPWPQNFVQSYVTHKTVRLEEKRKLRKRNSELKKEYSLLDEQDQTLSQALVKCMDLKNSLLGQQKETQASLERLRSLIRLIQRDQVIQVTMTATTTGASLLSLPWIKPTSTVLPAGSSALLQKSLPQTQGNN